jgi:hypothetical protein
MGYVAAALTIDSPNSSGQLAVEIRGRHVNASVVPLPFYKRESPSSKNS